MLRKILIIAVVLAIGFFCLSGCKESSSKPEVGTSETEVEQEAVKTQAEYKAEAEKEITKENMDTELEDLEKTIEEDIAAEP